jgi:hypothetical protein
MTKDQILQQLSDKSTNIQEILLHSNYQSIWTNSRIECIFQNLRNAILRGDSSEYEGYVNELRDIMRDHSSLLESLSKTKKLIKFYTLSIEKIHSMSHDEYEKHIHSTPNQKIS